MSQRAEQELPQSEYYRNDPKERSNIQAGEQNAMGDDPSAKIQHLHFEIHFDFCMVVVLNVCQSF